MRKFRLCQQLSTGKRTYLDDDWKKDLQDYCATEQGNYPQAPAVLRARFEHGVHALPTCAAFLFSPSGWASTDLTDPVYDKK
jgi:hypothetical protein